MAKHPKSSGPKPSPKTNSKTSPAKISQATKHPPEDLRRRVLADFAALRVPLDEASFDAHLSRSEQEGHTPLEFLARVVGEHADRKRERAIERRINEAHFAEDCTLADFDWQFNAATIDRGQIEQLATCDFLRR